MDLHKRLKDLVLSIEDDFSKLANAPDPAAESRMIQTIRLSQLMLQVLQKDQAIRKLV